jgi:hypothetical protein
MHLASTALLPFSLVIKAITASIRNTCHVQMDAKVPLSGMFCSKIKLEPLRMRCMEQGNAVPSKRQLRSASKGPSSWQMLFLFGRHVSCKQHCSGLTENQAISLTGVGDCQANNNVLETSQIPQEMLASIGKAKWYCLKAMYKQEGQQQQPT